MQEFYRSRMKQAEKWEEKLIIGTQRARCGAAPYRRKARSMNSYKLPADTSEACCYQKSAAEPVQHRAR